VSFGNPAHVRTALAAARPARTTHGGNGIPPDPPASRPTANLETVFTDEGTTEIHTLVMGQAITGLNAFT
jgi:glutaryl-CoA dehydrogenase